MCVCVCVWSVCVYACEKKQKQCLHKKQEKKVNTKTIQKIYLLLLKKNNKYFQVPEIKVAGQIHILEHPYISEKTDGIS